MANEITVSASLQATKSTASIRNSGSVTPTMAGDGMMTNVQAIGTSAEAIVFGDVSTIGYVYFKNMDSTNFVELALDSGVSTQVFAKLMPGDVAVFPAKTATMYAKADTDPVNLLVSACEL